MTVDGGPVLVVGVGSTIPLPPLDGPDGAGKVIREAVTDAADEVLHRFGVPGRARVGFLRAQPDTTLAQPVVEVSLDERRCGYPDDLPARVLDYVSGVHPDPATQILPDRMAAAASFFYRSIISTPAGSPSWSIVTR